MPSRRLDLLGSMSAQPAVTTVVRMCSDGLPGAVRFASSGAADKPDKRAHATANGYGSL